MLLEGTRAAKETIREYVDAISDQRTAAAGHEAPRIIPGFVDVFKNGISL
jgi:hypothetical protein